MTGTAAIILAIIGLYFIYQIKKYVDQKLEDATSSTFFGITLDHQNLGSHPFVVKSVIPELKKSKKITPAEVSKEVHIIKSIKDYGSLSQEELEHKAWGRLIYRLIYKDRGLGFGFVNIGGSDPLTWNGLTGALYPGGITDFSFNLGLDDDIGLGNLSLRGKMSRVEKNDPSSYALRVYFELTDFNKTDNERVGLLCDIPASLLGVNKFKIRNNQEAFTQVLNKFKVKEIEDKYGGDWFEDELGDTQLTDRPGFAIGNEYLEAHIL